MAVAGVRGIAIDDVELVDHACQVDEAMFCNFENDLCNFQNTGPTTWQKSTAILAGVVRDHTTRTPNGHLAFLDLSGDEDSSGILDGSLHSGHH